MSIFRLEPDRSHPNFPLWGFPVNLWFQVRAPDEKTARQTAREFVELGQSQEVYDQDFLLNAFLLDPAPAYFTCLVERIAEQAGPPEVLDWIGVQFVEENRLLRFLLQNQEGGGHFGAFPNAETFQATGLDSQTAPPAIRRLIVRGLAASFGNGGLMLTPDGAQLAEATPLNRWLDMRIDGT